MDEYWGNDHSYYEKPEKEENGCFYCGRATGWYSKPPLIQGETDHYWPLSRPTPWGKKTSAVISSCKECNMKKHARIPSVWASACFDEAIIGIARLRWILGNEWSDKRITEIKELRLKIDLTIFDAQHPPIRGLHLCNIEENKDDNEKIEK
jgi:hypothetical protein